MAPTSPPVAPSTQPAFIKRVGIINSVRLTNQVVARDGTGGVPVVIYDPTIHGDGNGALVESIQVMPVGVNAASVLFLFFSLATITPVRWDFWQELTLPAVTAAPAAAALTSGASPPYPLLVQLPPLLSPASPTTTPNRGLRLNGSGVIWAVALGSAVAAGVNVTLFGGEH
jgi:hypothetical protein